MTMQVAMVGTDGIVLASDTQWTQQGGIRHSFNATKIKINHARGMAVSCARNMETSTKVANLILSGSKDCPAPSCYEIEELVAKVLREAGQRSDAQCLIVSLRPQLRLFRFQTILIGDEAAPKCEEIRSKAVVGDDGNPALFWSERYYECRPMKALVLLAAHLVITARKFNSGMISGLEIVLCDSTAIRHLDEDSIRQLESKAREIDDSLRGSLASYSQQFNYVPNVIG